MKLAAVAGPLGALKDARIQAAGRPKPDRSEAGDVVARHEAERP